MLADDTVIFAKNIRDVKETLDTFEKFKYFSGLRVNIEKTSAVYIGSLKNRREHNILWPGLVKEKCGYAGCYHFGSRN